MTTLSGNQIQNLLWEEGLDFSYLKTHEDYDAIDIVCGDRFLRLEKLWDNEYGDGWVLDVGDILISVVDGASVTLYTDSMAMTEEDLVNELKELYAELV